MTANERKSGESGIHSTDPQIENSKKKNQQIIHLKKFPIHLFFINTKLTYFGATKVGIHFPQDLFFLKKGKKVVSLEIKI